MVLYTCGYESNTEMCDTSIYAVCIHTVKSKCKQVLTKQGTKFNCTRKINFTYHIIIINENFLENAIIFRDPVFPISEVISIQRDDFVSLTLNL